MADVRIEKFYKEHEHDYWQCPFCAKGKPTTLCLWIGSDNLYYVKCDRCGAQTGSYIKQQDATNSAHYESKYIIKPEQEESNPVPNTTHRAARIKPEEEE